MGKQVNSDYYHFSNYCFPERWPSYWHQLDEIIKQKPASVLEVGPGDGLVGGYLKRHTDINYKSLDIAADLNPDFIGSADAMPLKENSFDIVCAFEVLEHLPYERFPSALKELGRVAKKNVLISLPHWGRHFSIEIRLPYFKNLRWQYKLNLFPIKHHFNGQHYWEIGKKGYPLKKIKNTIEANGLKITRDYIAFDSPYHHFFILEKIIK